jgi:hypothetical protein
LSTNVIANYSPDQTTIATADCQTFSRTDTAAFFPTVYSANKSTEHITFSTTINSAHNSTYAHSHRAAITTTFKTTNAVTIATTFNATFFAP